MNFRKFAKIAVCGLFALFAGSALSAFDPVHEDIDIFMVNPAITSQRPNILIILDNTANWSQRFANEKAALNTVVNGLNSTFNVGLGMYVETGGGNDNNDGAYIRFAVRQMEGTAQSTLGTMVANLSENGDKGNNVAIGLAMSEAYKYFLGGTSYSSYGKAKTDFSQNAANSAGSLSSNALPANPTSTSSFNSPVTDDCQKNFIIYIGNGKFNENASARSTAESRLQAASGSTPQQLAISPSGQADNWADEWAKFMANTGFTKTIGGQSKKVFVHTYAVAIDPTSNSWNADSLRLMKSMSEDNGKGRYFPVDGGNGGADIVAALTQIFNEIQSVNSVFASTTLPVSVNVRGTNLNQVYIGMFRPDTKKLPRWYGNLKMYKLALDSSQNLYMADAAGQRAQDQGTGFVGSTNRSHWTHPSSFWDFRSAEENGSGGTSDSPDGDLVEKGAVAQWLRENYASSQTTRNLYTCTAGTVSCTSCSIGSGACTGSFDVSATPFATSNDGITTLNLGLGTKDVANLTAKVTKTITDLTDRRPVTLTNSSGATVNNISLSNGAITGTISQLQTATTKTITALTAAQAASLSIQNVTETYTGNGSNRVHTITVTTTGNHGFSAGNSVVIANRNTDLNGTRTIATIPSSTTFTIVLTGNLSPTTGSGGTVSGTQTTNTAYATVAAHGFASNDQVTIAGAAPSVFNGTFNITMDDANTFHYVLTSAQGAATTLGTATANSTTATAVTTTTHGLAAGNSVTISSASPTGYNGTVTVLATPAPTANTFAYTVGSKLSPNTVSNVTYYKTSTGSSTVTATSAAPHNLTSGTYSITGPNNCFTGSSVPITVTGTSTFAYSTGSTCTSAPGSPYTLTGTTTLDTVTATLTAHNFAAQCSGGSVTIYGAAPHAGTWSPISVVDANTFTYSTGSALALPSGNYTAACSTSPRAFATSAGHGFASNDTITISGVDTTGGNAGNSLYNTSAVINVAGSDNFDYPLTSAVAGPATTTTALQASKNTTTAVATSVNHGFADGASIIISGASPSAFNGTFVIAGATTNTFTYPLSSAQGDATGTIVAAAGSGSSSERDLIINWVRGQDNNENENSNLNADTTPNKTDCRASVHGDVLHSRPAVINYNRYGGDNDVYIFYGANDGVFRAVKGGDSNDAGDATTLYPGHEAWGFVPEESFSALKRLRNNSPVIGSAFKKPYFMDGPIGTYTVDGNGDGKISTGGSDAAYLYITARRGGRYLYSLDITDPVAPKFRWKITSASSGFGEMGYTWSQPTVVTGITGYTNPVLMFGGGYDPAVEDIENCTIQSATTTAVQYYTGAIKYTSTGCTKDDGTAIIATSTPNATISRSMGRGIYVADAITGELIWRAGRTGSGANLEVDGMDFAIAADPIVVRNTSGGAINRAYFADTGGNVWRFDFNTSDRTLWTITKIAALGDLTTAAGRRKFLYPPDVVGESGYDAVLIGSGDREHPFDMSVTNRFYMLKDRGNDSGPVTGVNNASGSASPTIVETALYDGSSVSQTTANSGSTDAQKAAALTTGATGLASKEGWYITFAAGEKDVGNAVSLNGVVFFNTNVSPMSPSVTNSTQCESNLGIANQYEVGITTLKTKIVQHAGGGYLPSPHHVVVKLPYTDPVTGQTVDKIVEGVISGTEVRQPPGVTLGTRVRRYWYKDID